MKANHNQQMPDLRNEINRKDRQDHLPQRVIKNPHRKLPRKEFHKEHQKDRQPQRPRGEDSMRGRGNPLDKKIRFESQKKRGYSDKKQSQSDDETL